MKKVMLVSAMMLTALVGMAKDIKTVVVTTQPLMHCASCENKIKGNLRFEKGVKQIECSIPDQRVTVTYDADKTTPENIIKGFEKFGYKATEIKKEAEQKTEKNSEKKTEKKTEKK